MRDADRPTSEKPLKTKFGEGLFYEVG